MISSKDLSMVMQVYNKLSPEEQDALIDFLRSQSAEKVLSEGGDGVGRAKSPTENCSDMKKFGVSVPDRA